MKKFTSVDPVQLRSYLARFSYFKDMEGLPFDVHFVSPLFNFSFNEMYLNRVSYEFTKHIQKKYEGSDAALLLLSKPPRLPCVSVKVVDRENVLFCALMMSVSTIPDGPYTALPLMCIVINKKVGLGNRVISFLEKRFSCAITTCELSDVQFQWLMGIAVNETINRHMNGGITITHRMSGCRACIHYTLTPDDFLALWKECTRGSAGRELNWKSVLKFVLAVNEHFSNTFGLNDIGIPVERVVVKGVSIARLNTLRMKVTNAGVIFMLLQYVENICLKDRNSYSLLNCVRA